VTVTGTATTTLQGPAPCPKNVLTRLLSRRPLEHRSGVHVSARQKDFCTSRWLRHASGIAVAADDPVNEGDPRGTSPLGDQCPQGTTDYTSQADIKYNCIGIEPTQFGTNIWIRKGSSPSFGLAHVQRPKHDLSLLALEWLLWYRVMPTNQVDDAGSQRYDAYFKYPGYPTYTLGVEVRAQVGLNYARYQSPDGYPIGVITAYCFRPGGIGAISCPKNINYLIIAAPSDPNPPILNSSEVSNINPPDDADTCGMEGISTGSWYTGPVAITLTPGQID
jgi:hypothetical protein